MCVNKREVTVYLKEKISRLARHPQEHAINCGVYVFKFGIWIQVTKFRVS